MRSAPSVQSALLLLLPPSSCTRAAEAKVAVAVAGIVREADGRLHDLRGGVPTATTEDTIDASIYRPYWINLRIHCVLGVCSG
jgi:hypothetical protein